MPGPYKVGFVSLGCPKNLVDSEVMMGQLVARGHQLTPDPAEADVLVINTCSFIDPPEGIGGSHPRDGRIQKSGRARKLIVRAAWWNATRTPSARKCGGRCIIGTNDLESIVAVCEGMEGRRFHPSRTCITTSRRACSRLRAISLTSKSRKAATTLHFLRHPAVSRPFPQPPSRIRRLRSRAPLRTGRPRNQFDRAGHHSYGEDLGLTDGLARLLERLAQIETRARNGSASSTPTPTGSRKSCWTPWPRIRRWSSTSTCRCSTRAPASSSV